ncbi:unnamed protein product [Ectocarpus fasciculatus]
MTFQGVHGLVKGAAQLMKAFGKCLRVPPTKPNFKVNVIGVAALLQFVAKVFPFGIGAVVLQNKGPDKGDTEDKDESNNANWIACHAYM